MFLQSPTLQRGHTCTKGINHNQFGLIARSLFVYEEAQARRYQTYRVMLDPVCNISGTLLPWQFWFSGGIVLQILACALYDNWWPMLTVIMYVLLPMPLLLFAGSKGSTFSESDSGWVNATKFLTGASAIGSIAIPAILKHAGVISLGAMAMEIASYVVFILAIMRYIRRNNEDDYSIL